MSGYNFTGIIVGPPGFGKTTLQRALVRRHLAQPTGVVLAHDPLYQFGKDGCHAYKDAAAWRAAAVAAAAKKLPMPRGASIGGRSEDVTQLALDMGERLNRANDTRVAILTPYDEGSLLSSSGSTYMGDAENETLALRRHRGVGAVYNLQEPKQLTAKFYRMSTDVYLFRQTEENAHHVEKHMLLEKNELLRAGVTRLPEHRYLHVRLGKGLVAEAL